MAPNKVHIFAVDDDGGDTDNDTPEPEHDTSSPSPDSTNPNLGGKTC